MKKLLVALGTLTFLFVIVTVVFGVTASYNSTIRIVDSVGNVLNGTASAVTALYNQTVQVVDSTGHVIDSFSGGPVTNPTRIGNVIYAVSNADLGISINNCVAASLAQNANGGLCDATNLTSGTITTPVIISKGVRVQMGAGTFSCNTGAASDCVTVYETASLFGISHISQAWGAPGTMFKAADSAALTSVIHAISQSGSGSWWHEGEIGYLGVNANGANTGTTDAILIDRCGETSRIHDIWEANATTGVGYHFKNSQAGCAGGQNLEMSTNLYGLELDTTTSKISFQNLSGDNDGSQIYIHSGTGPISFRDIKSEFTAGTSATQDPWMLIDGTTAADITIDGLQVIGNTTSGACTNDWKSQSSGGVKSMSCSMIKIGTSGSGMKILGHNMVMAGYAHQINNATTGTSVFTDYMGVGQYPDVCYTSKSGPCSTINADSTTGVVSGQTTLMHLGIAQKIWGSVTQSGLGTPGTVVSVTPTGAAGATTYYYKATCVDAAGNETLPGASATTATGNATLTASNYNDIVTPICQGARSMCLYSSADNITFDKVGCMPAVQLSNGNGNAEYYDHGQTHVGGVPPVTDGTKGLTLAAPLAVAQGGTGASTTALSAGGNQPGTVAVPLNTNEFFALGPSTANFGATATFQQQPVSSTYTVKNLYCQAATTAGGGVPGNTFTYTVQQNGSDTALTCSRSGATTACNDTTHSFVTSPGDRLSIKFGATPGSTPTTTPVASFMGCSVGP